MRIYALWLVVAFLSLNAWRHWFWSLLGLIVLTTVFERRDMPKAIMGISGLNAWNIVLLCVIGALCVRGGAARERWDPPRGMVLALLGFLAVVVIAWVRAVFDIESIPKGAEYHATFSGMTIDELVNPLKYLIPGVLVFYGVRGRRRMVATVVCLLAAAVLYAVLVSRVIPLDTLWGGDFMRYRHRIGRDTGLNAVDMSTVLVGGFWSLIAALAFWKDWRARAALGVGAAIVFVGCALCQSRGGFAAMAAVGVALGVFRFRWMLAAMPVAAVVIALTMPSIPQRLGMGLDVVDEAGDDSVDWATATAGRTTSLWPPVLEQIEASPLIGHGRRAILRTDAYNQIMAADGVVPTHPHNAYLEMLSDAGVVGLLVSLAFYGYLLWRSTVLCMQGGDPVFRLVGAMGIATVGAWLVAGLGAQSLFPKISGMIMWVTCGLVIRASVEHARLLAAAPARRAAPAPRLVGA